MCWLFGSRQHCQIRGIGDKGFFFPLLVATGCPTELRNRTGAGHAHCTACEARVKDPPAMPIQQYNLEGNLSDSVYRPPNFDCEACLPHMDDVMSCRLGVNWRYCDANSDPALREAMSSGCGDPFGPCTFWRSAIEEACPLPYDCPGTDALPLIAVVAACSMADPPLCSGLTPNAPEEGNHRPDGYNAMRPAWVLGPRNYREDLVGGVPTAPKSRVARGIF